MYSLALILIEVLVGEPVRSGDSVSAVLRAAHHEAIDVRHVPGSPALRSVLARALDPRVASRYESPSEMRMELLQTPEASEMQTVIRRLGR